jgi:hypothetical protein
LLPLSAASGHQSLVLLLLLWVLQELLPAATGKPCRATYEENGFYSNNNLAYSRTASPDYHH